MMSSNILHYVKYNIRYTISLLLDMLEALIPAILKGGISARIMNQGVYEEYSRS